MSGDGQLERAGAVDVVLCPRPRPGHRGRRRLAGDDRSETQIVVMASDRMPFLGCVLVVASCSADIASETAPALLVRRPQYDPSPPPRAEVFLVENRLNPISTRAALELTDDNCAAQSRSTRSGSRRPWVFQIAGPGFKQALAECYIAYFSSAVGQRLRNSQRSGSNNSSAP